MKYAFTFYGKPLSTQHCYKMTCRGSFPSMYMSDECKSKKMYYANAARYDFKAQNGVIIKGNILMSVSFYFGDRRKRDIDNFNKLLLDAMSGIVYEDDKQIVQLHLEKYYDKEKPRVEVVITEE